MGAGVSPIEGADITTGIAQLGEEWRDSMALPKRKDGKKPGLMIAIGVGKPKSSPQDLGGPKPVDEPDADDQGGPPDNDADDQPGAQGGGEQTRECEPDPEAVCFRSEQETCQYCDYMEGDRCTHPIVNMPVKGGDSCNAFRPKQQGSDDEQPQPQGQPAQPGNEPVEEQS